MFITTRKRNKNWTIGGWYTVRYFYFLLNLSDWDSLNIRLTPFIRHLLFTLSTSNTINHKFHYRINYYTLAVKFISPCLYVCIPLCKVSKKSLLVLFKYTSRVSSQMPRSLLTYGVGTLRFLNDPNSLTVLLPFTHFPVLTLLL